MKSLSNKLIIYDSNCKVCSSLRDVVLRLTSIPESKVKAFRDLEGDLVEKVDPEKFRNVMALIDTTGGKTIYGAEGIAHIFSSEYRIADFLFRSKAFFRFFSFLYKTQAYNRYIIAAPKSNFKCDCFPERVVKYRISYITIALTISIVLTALFGISLTRFFPGMSFADGMIQMLLIAGSGWVMQIALAVFLLKEKLLDYIGHLTSIMVAGLLVLIPSMVLTAIPQLATPWLPAISVLISSALMLHLHIGRVRHLEMSQGWTLSWFLLLQSTALYWVLFFHLN